MARLPVLLKLTFCCATMFYRRTLTGSLGHISINSMIHDPMARAIILLLPGIRSSPVFQGF